MNEEFPMREMIRTRLEEIERQNDIAIFYACESGSRAWGFPSTDSDYDARFIYLHPVEWYLSIAEKRDVVECAVSDKLDINGWDLRKALKLFRKSNPPLLEWLGSPIIYLEKLDIAARMRSMASIYYSPVACIHHYLHMAQGNYRQYLKGEQVWLKKYFYVLRPLLAIKWIEQGYGVAPTAFGTLLDRVVTAQPLRAEIQNLIMRKQSGAELDHGPRIPEISDFIESELARLESNKVGYASNAAPIQELDKFFQQALAEVWH